MSSWGDGLTNPQIDDHARLLMLPSRQFAEPNGRRFSGETQFFVAG
jgi:hypothetical protein